MSFWDNLLKSQGCSLVNLFPREVPRVLNLFTRELIEGNPKEFFEGKPEAASEARPKAKNPRGRRVCGFLAEGLAEDAAEGLPEEKLRGAFNQLPREQIENSRDFLREQIHHATSKVFQEIVILTKSLQFWSGLQ